jgi:2'-5' RNA ligase
VLVLSRVARGTHMATPGVLCVDEAPLGGVLAKASAFVHHGGIGSVAQGFAALVPQLLLASAYDQFENAMRVEQLGQGCRQNLTQATPASIQYRLDALSKSHMGALVAPPRPSGAGDPNVAIEDTGDLLESMRDQFDLPGFAPPKTPLELDDPGVRGRPKGYTLLLAILPLEDTARQLDQLAIRLVQQHGLASSQRVSSSRLHVTLHEVASFSVDEGVSRDVVDAAIVAGDRVASTPLSLIFDRAMSFRGSDAFVLRCDAQSDAAVARLRQALAVELRRVGLRPKPSSTPHMTMLYDRKTHVSEHPIEPTQWVATRFVLIVSHVGVTHHQWVREWPLK